MKYQQHRAFEKHLQEAFPNHLSSIYMILNPCDFERRKTIENILKLLHQRYPQANKQWLVAGANSIQELLTELNTSSLFEQASIIVCDKIEYLKNEETQLLASYLRHPSPFHYLILGGAALKGDKSFYTHAKKELVLLDLSEEKPWERHRRLKEWLVSRAQVEQKKMHPDAVAELFERVGADMARLEQEVIKLACFVGERKEITLQDIKTVAAPAAALTSWSLVEKIVWEEELPSTEGTYDSSTFFALLGQLRYHLQLGIQLSALIEEGQSLDRIASFFPQIKNSATLEKYYQRSTQYGKDFFQQALQALFKMEFNSKGGGLSFPLSWDYFLSQLAYLKMVYAS